MMCPYKPYYDPRKKTREEVWIEDHFARCGISSPAW